MRFGPHLPLTVNENILRQENEPLLQSNSPVFLFLCPCQIPELSWGRIERESCARRLSTEWDKVPCHSCSPGKAQICHCCAIKCSLQFPLQCSIGFHTLFFFPGFALVSRVFCCLFFYGLLNISIQALPPFISVGNMTGVAPPSF